MRGWLLYFFLPSCSIVLPSLATATGQQNPVRSGPPAGEEIFDIYPPLPMPEPVNWPLYLAGCVVLLLLGAVLFWFVKSRKNEAPAMADPHGEALAALDAARNLINNDQPLAYAQKTSTILRNFIEIQFSISSTKQTTSEFLGGLTDDSSIYRQILPFKKDLKHCLASFDLAKYAHKPASREQLEEIDRAIRNFIISVGEES